MSWIFAQYYLILVVKEINSRLQRRIVQRAPVLKIHFDEMRVPPFYGSTVAGFCINWRKVFGKGCSSFRMMDGLSALSCTPWNEYINGPSSCLDSVISLVWHLVRYSLNIFNWHQVMIEW